MASRWNFGPSRRQQNDHAALTLKPDSVLGRSPHSRSDPKYGSDPLPISRGLYWWMELGFFAYQNTIATMVSYRDVLDTGDVIDTTGSPSSPLISSRKLVAMGAMREDLSPCNTLYYTAPAKEWSEALPIGNGRLRAMVCGRTSKELLQLNENSMWYGGPQTGPARRAEELAPALRSHTRRPAC